MGRLPSMIIRNSLESFFGTAPRALMLMGMLALSAIAKWSLTNYASNWSLAPCRQTDLLLCVKACETIESGERSWNPCLAPFKIKSMSGSLFSSVAQVPKTKSMETLSAWGCCLNSEKGPTWIGKRSPHSAGSGVLKTGWFKSLHLTMWSRHLLLVL